MRCKSCIGSLLLLAWPALNAQVPEYSHQVVRAFHTPDPVTVDIVNKYGKVQVATWDKDSVRIAIDLRIRAKDATKLEKVKQSIDFEFTSGESYLVAHTRIGDAGSDVWKDLVDIAGAYLSSSNSVVINYMVMIPGYAGLKIDNKFGDVFMDNVKGELKLVLSYGDLTCNRLEGKSDLRITSGSGEIHTIRDGILYLSYGNLHIREAGRLTADTRSSNITIDKVSDLQINTRRDKIFLNDCGSLSGTAYFSQVNCGALRQDVDFKGRYGNVTFDDIQTSFSSVRITTEYTDVSLGFEKPALFDFEMNHHQDLTFVYPKNMATLQTRVTDADSKMFRTAGVFGSGDAVSRVVIDAPRRCNITLSIR